MKLVQLLVTVVSFRQTLLYKHSYVLLFLIYKTVTLDTISVLHDHENRVYKKGEQTMMINLLLILL